MGFQIINDKYSNGMMVWMELLAKTVLGVGGMDLGIHSYLVEVYLWQSGAAEGGLMAARAMVAWKLGVFHRKTIRKDGYVD